MITYMLTEDEERRLCNIQVICNNFIENAYENYFNDGIITFFPVVEKTKYASKDLTLPKKTIPYFASTTVQYHTFNINCQTLIDRNLTKDMFKEHSLFLLKESLKTFSPYSDKAKELLKKLESLDE